MNNDPAYYTERVDDIAMLVPGTKYRVVDNGTGKSSMQIYEGRSPYPGMISFSIDGSIGGPTHVNPAIITIYRNSAPIRMNHPNNNIHIWNESRGIDVHLEKGSNDENIVAIRRQNGDNVTNVTNEYEYSSEQFRKLRALMKLQKAASNRFKNNIAGRERFAGNLRKIDDTVELSKIKFLESVKKKGGRRRSQRRRTHRRKSTRRHRTH